MWRGEEEEGTIKVKVEGGDNGGNEDGPGGAERSGEEWSARRMLTITVARI